MAPQETKLNPYAPPETSAAAMEPIRQDADRSKPIIPAVIGVFTYGSSSPYALVLCIEHYLSYAWSAIPWSTHVAMVLSILGTIGWIGLNLIVSLNMWMYGGLAFYLWGASLAFVIWMICRIVLFQRKAASSRLRD